MKGLSLIIPVHNGGKVIEKSIYDYNALLSRQFKDFEIIAVCNGCIDNTVEVCKSLTTEYPLKVIEIPQRGKGYALIRGFNEAKFELLGFLDADNPFEFTKITKMIEDLNHNCDLVIATKYLRGKTKIQDSQIRRIISLTGSIVSRFLFGLNFRDTQAGAKFFKKEVWTKIDNNFICRGFDFDIEFLYKARKKGFKIGEFYTPLLKYEKFSTFRLKYLPGMVKRLLILRFFR